MNCLHFLKLTCAATLAVLVLAAPSGDARAQAPAPPPQQPREYNDPGYHRHDGFYLRTFLGLGGMTMSAEDADVSVSGTGGAFGIALGGAISDNLVLYGELFDDIAIDPTIKLDGMKLETQDTNAGVVGLGVGLAYYLMPANVYVSGTVAASQLTVQQNGEEIGESDFGLGLSLMVGKEWWASANWGLGIAGQAFLGSMKDKGGENAPTWNTAAFAIAFSATYN